MADNMFVPSDIVMETFMTNMRVSKSIFDRFISYVQCFSNEKFTF